MKIEREETNEKALTVALDHYQISAAMLAPEEGQQATAIGLVLTERMKEGATGEPKKIVFEFSSDDQFCQTMSLLIEAAKTVWPRGWEQDGKRERVAPRFRSCKGIREQVTIHGGHFDTVAVGEHNWRVALISVPAEVPPNAVAFTFDRPKAKPLLVVIERKSVAREFLAMMVDACERLWTSDEPKPAAPSNMVHRRPRHRRRGGGSR